MRNFPFSNAKRVTLNVSILIAVVGVALAVVIQHIAASANIAAPISFVPLILVLATFIYALFLLVVEGVAIWQEPEKTLEGYSRVGSFMLGSFIFFLILLTVTDSSSQNLFFAVVAIGCLLSLVCCIALLQLWPPEAATVLPEVDRIQQPFPAPGDYRGNPLPSPIRLPIGTPVETLEPPKQRVDPSTLPLLFESDSLYLLPQPQRARFFTVAKGNDHLVNSEDACIIEQNETCFALCDGASGSRLSRPWAALLGKRWIKSPFQQTTAIKFHDWLQEPRKLWEYWVTNTWKKEVDKRNKQIGRAPVSDETLNRTLEIGASATFLGLKLNYQTSTWYAVALGDTCLFIFHRDSAGNVQLPPACLPLTRSAQFGDRPLLINSKEGSVETLATRLAISGEQPMQRGDTFLMATDALAKWLLGQFEQRQQDWQFLLKMSDPNDFAQSINNQRQRPKGGMDDDDTTMVVITV